MKLDLVKKQMNQAKTVVKIPFVIEIYTNLKFLILEFSGDDFLEFPKYEYFFGTKAQTYKVHSRPGNSGYGLFFNIRG